MYVCTYINIYVFILFPKRVSCMTSVLCVCVPRMTCTHLSSVWVNSEAEVHALFVFFFLQTHVIVAIRITFDNPIRYVHMW